MLKIAFWVAIVGAGLVILTLPRISLYRTAKAQGISQPWLVWLPLGDQLLLGTISDQYQQRNYGRNTMRRWLLPALGVLTTACLLMTIVLFLSIIIYVLLMAFASVCSLGLIYLHNDLESVFGCIREPAVLMIIVWFGFVCSSVPRYWAVYDLYRSGTAYSTTFLVLSILIPITEPMLIFCVRPRGKNSSVR